MSDNSEENRKIMLWLGWREVPFRSLTANPPVDVLWWVDESNRPVSEPDFRRSEEASALLLDGMLDSVCPATDLPTHFRWAWQYVAKLIMEEIQYSQNNDRKTAIVMAVLKLIEQEGTSK